MKKASNVMDKNRFRAIAMAIVVMVGAGATQVMAQMGGGGAGSGGMTDWRNTNQYGGFGILALLIGVAILTLLVVLVVKKSRT